MAGLRPGPDGRLVPATWPGIVERETWVRVSLALAPAVLVRLDGALAQASRPRGPAFDPLLPPGLVFCAGCGAPLRARPRRHPDGQQFTLYRCDRRVGGGCVGIRASVLEPLVVSALFDRLADPDVARGLEAPDREDRGPLARELAEAEGELAELVTIRERDAITRGEWRGLLAGYAEWTRRLGQRLGRLDLPRRDPFDLPARWPELTLAARHSVLFAVVERIEVAPVRDRHRGAPRVRLCWREPCHASASAG